MGEERGVLFRHPSSERELSEKEKSWLFAAEREFRERRKRRVLKDGEDHRCCWCDDGAMGSGLRPRSLFVGSWSRSRHWCELRHDREQPAGAGAGDLHVQGQEHQLRAAVPPGHGRARRAPRLRHRRRARHAERGPRPPRLRRVLRLVVGGLLRPALRRRRPVPVHQRRQRGDPRRPGRARAPGHAEPRVGAPVGRGRRRLGDDGRRHFRARRVVPAVAGRVLRGGGAGDGADRVLPGVQGRAAAGERVPVLRLLDLRREGGAGVRAAVVGQLRRGGVVAGDGRRRGVHQHVRRDRGRGARGSGEGRRAGLGAGGVGDRVAVGRRGRRHSGERGGVQQQRGAARRRGHAAAAREARGDVPVRHVQREPEARGRGAALWPLPAGHERGLPRQLRRGGVRSCF